MTTIKTIHLDRFTITCDADDEADVRRAYEEFPDVDGGDMELRRALTEAGAKTIVDEDFDN